jgi:hypothetical protein
MRKHFLSSDDEPRAESSPVDTPALLCRRFTTYAS